jgi:hypothetical protein
VVGTIKKYLNIPKEIRNIQKFKEPSRKRQRDRDSNVVEGVGSDKEDTTIIGAEKKIERKRKLILLKLKSILQLEIHHLD